MSVHVGPSATWDDQVVPALRNRLETESTYLSHRLSATQFPDTSPSSSPSPSHAHVPARTRTKSTPFALDTLIPAYPPPQPPLSDEKLPRRHASMAPSAIPVLKSRSISPNKPVLLFPGRESPEFDGPHTHTKEGFIKNELPPFRLLAGEAMSIARDGHVDAENEDVVPRRTRAETMRTTPSPTKDRPSASRQNSSSTTPQPPVPKFIGLGHPQRKPTSSSSRSASSSNRNHSSSPAGSGSGFAPRSASLNMLATPSRLGVAAHFVPPENTYTPPKGADWDEVVLPAVARKLGIGEGDRGDRIVQGDEGDLAVEWDKEGRAIKWVKREKREHPLSNTDFSANSNSSSQRSTSFSPTFEPSPDNPLSPNPLPSNSHLHPAPARLALEQPLRTSNAYHTSLSQEPASPAPFTSLQTVDVDADLGPPPEARKPSLLRKPSSTTRIAHPEIQRGPLPQQLQRNEIARGDIPTTILGQGPEGKRKKDDEAHGKGCGCVIM
ncbi:hypothetical protein P7C73_g2111, partial [Tremellales sp. Uapishka_1]